MKAANFIDTNAPLYHERFCLSERVLHHLFHVFQKEFLSLTHLTKEQFSTLLQFNLIELSHREDGSVSGWCWRMGSFHDRAFTCICGCRWNLVFQGYLVFQVFPNLCNDSHDRIMPVLLFFGLYVQRFLWILIFFRWWLQNAFLISNSK